MTRYDKLGRRIPDFDRSAASKKGAQTRKANEGEDVFQKIGAEGGRKSKRGHFGTLADTNPEALKAISDKGNEAKRARKVQTELRGSSE